MTNSAGRRRSTSRIPATSMSFKAITKTTDDEHGARHVRQRLGEEQQDDRHAERGRDLRDLAAPAGAIDHRGLRRAAVDDERARRRRPRGSPRSRPDEIDVLVEAVAELRRVGARGRGALGEDHDEDRGGGAEQGRQVAARRRSASEARQAARERCRASRRRGPRGRRRSSRRSRRRRRAAPTGTLLESRGPTHESTRARPRRRAPCRCWPSRCSLSAPKSWVSGPPWSCRSRRACRRPARRRPGCRRR